MVASSVGTQHIAVTRRSARNVVQVRARAGSTPAGLGTSVAPAAHGTQISSTEKSNAMVMPW